MATKVNVKSDAQGYMHDISLLLGALGKHLERINDIELSGVDRFTLAGLAMAVGTQQQILFDKLQDWGLLTLPKK